MGAANVVRDVAVAAEQKRSKRRQPDDYVKVISSHSLRTKSVSLHPGLHYRSFASFLQPRQFVAPNATTDGESRPHVFAVLHDLQYDPGHPKRVTPWTSADGPHGLLSYPFPQNNCGQLLFLRGLPSSEWLNAIGSKYSVDPEFFRRHLSFGHASNLFELPSLPSTSGNMLRLCVPSIGTRDVTTILPSQVSDALQKYQYSLRNDAKLIGESIIRRLTMHDDQHFSLEQEISIFIIHRATGWVALILLDNGRDFGEDPNHQPWFAPYASGEPSFDDVFLPVIQHEPKIVFREVDNKASELRHLASSYTTTSKLSQSAALLASPLYGRFLHPEIARSDTFYALHELFSFAASAESQFLNFLREKYDATSALWDDDRYMQETSKSLRQHKTLLYAHIERLKTTVDDIKRRETVGWPKMRPARKIVSSPPKLSPPSSIADAVNVITNKGGPVSEGSERSYRSGSTPTLYSDGASSSTPTQFSFLVDRADAAAADLLQDYQALLRQAEALLQLYKDGIDDISNAALLQESRKSLEQATWVARLTLLAFFFIPLSFTTSFFGMNFRELGTEQSIWIFFATSAPILAITTVLCFKDEVWMGFRRTWHQAKKATTGKSRVPTKVEDKSSV